MKEKHVVVIYPHPDDEAFGAAGTIANFRAEGVPVTYLCGTLGEMGRNMGNPIFANRETLKDFRKQELIEACRVLDIDLVMLGYRDKTLEFEDRNEIALDLKERIETLEPSLIITHYPGYAVHPDHNALGAAAIEAVRLMEPEKRPVVWAQAISNDYQSVLGDPDIVNDITDVFDKKMDAILAHSSQAQGVLGQRKGDTEEEIDLRAIAKERMGLEQFYIWKY